MNVYILPINSKHNGYSFIEHHCKCDPKNHQTVFLLKEIQDVIWILTPYQLKAELFWNLIHPCSRHT